METINFDIINIIYSNLNYIDIFEFSYTNKYFYNIYKDNRKYIKSSSIIDYDVLLNNNLFDIFKDVKIKFNQRAHKLNSENIYNNIYSAIITEDINQILNYKNLKLLTVFNRTINNLNIIQSMFNLTKLDISYTDIDDITFVSGLVNLKYLDINYTKIKDLSPLKHLVNLKTLNIIKINVNTFDIFKNMILLENLIMYNCTFENDLNYDNLKYLVNLKELNIANTVKFNFSYLTSLTRLTRLCISCTDITDIEPLSYLVNLKKLYMVSIFNKLDLKPILKLNNLNILKVNDWHDNYDLIKNIYDVS